LIYKGLEIPKRFKRIKRYKTTRANQKPTGRMPNIVSFYAIVPNNILIVVVKIFKKNSKKAARAEFCPILDHLMSG